MAPAKKMKCKIHKFFGSLLTIRTFSLSYIIQSNGLPDHDMQQVNPNTASAQSFRYTFKKEIDFACQPGSLPKGSIGITKTGVAIYNPLTSADLNAGMVDLYSIPSRL